MSSVLSFPAQLLLYASIVNCVDQKLIFKNIKIITCGAFSHLPVGTCDGCKNLILRVRGNSSLESPFSRHCV